MIFLVTSSTLWFGAARRRRRRRRSKCHTEKHTYTRLPQSAENFKNHVDPCIEYEFKILRKLFSNTYEPEVVNRETNLNLLVQQCFRSRKRIQNRSHKLKKEHRPAADPSAGCLDACILRGPDPPTASTQMANSRRLSSRGKI